MPRTAAELPPGVRRQILQQIESQLGYPEYQRLVRSMGEDGILDMVLQPTFAPTPVPSPGRSRWSGPRRFRMFSAADLGDVTWQATFWTFVLPAGLYGALGLVGEKGVLAVFGYIFALASWAFSIHKLGWGVLALAPPIWVIVWIVCATVKFCEKR